MRTGPGANHYWRERLPSYAEKLEEGETGIPKGLAWRGARPPGRSHARDSASLRSGRLQFVAPPDLTGACHHDSLGAGEIPLLFDPDAVGSDRQGIVGYRRRPDLLIAYEESPPWLRGDRQQGVLLLGRLGPPRLGNATGVAGDVRQARGSQERLSWWEHARHQWPARHP